MCCGQRCGSGSAGVSGARVSAVEKGGVGRASGTVGGGIGIIDLGDVG